MTGEIETKSGSELSQCQKGVRLELDQRINGDRTIINVSNCPQSQISVRFELDYRFQGGSTTKSVSK